MDLKKFVRAVTYYSIIIFIALNLVALILDAHIRCHTIFKSNLIFNQLEANSLILGSSRALTGVGAKQLTTSTKEQWYNLSIDDTPVETHLLVLELLIEKGNTPNCLLLQFDESKEKGDYTKIHDRDYQFLPYAYYDNGLLWEYMKYKQNGFGALLYLIPILKYAYYNTELFFPAVGLIFNPNYHHRFDESGDYSYPVVTTFVSTCTSRELKIINLQNKILARINSLCVENDIRLFVFTAPYRCQTADIVPNKEIFYYNYSTIFNEDSYFYDEMHINDLGKDAFTQIILKEAADACSF